MERIQCPAQLPENPAIALLTKMLVPAPYKAPEKKAKKKGQEARSALHRKGTSDATSEDKAHSPATEENMDEEEEESDSPPDGGRKKRKPPQLWRQRRPKRGRAFQWSTPHGTLTTVQNDAPALSPRPRPK